MKSLMICTFLLCMSVPLSGHAQQAAPMVLEQTITLPVTGKFDHMAVDWKNNRAFVAASQHGTIEVLDLTTGKPLKSIPNKGKPAGVIYSPELDKVVYSTDAGWVRFLNPNSLEIEADLQTVEDADSMGLDSQAQVAFVDAGGKDLGTPYSVFLPVDIKTHKSLGDVKIDGNRLEAVCIETNGHRGFVNDTALNKVVVFDRETRKETGSWDISAVAKENVPMVLDETDHRMFVGTRKPGMLLVLDTDSGKIVAHLPATGFADDLSYDAKRKRIYMSGGDGFLDIYQQKSPDSYVQIGKIPTRAQARTSRWVPELDRLYLEVPAINPGDPAEIRVFKPVD